MWCTIPSQLVSNHRAPSVVGRITVPSINRLWSPVWRLSACLESGIIYDILFNIQNLSKILLKRMSYMMPLSRRSEDHTSQLHSPHHLLSLLLLANNTD